MTTKKQDKRRRPNPKLSEDMKKPRTKGNNLAGRKALLSDPKFRANFLRLLRAGNTIKGTCRVMGVHPRMYWVWTKKGREDPESEIYGGWEEECQEAIHQGQAALVSSWMKAAVDGDWRAAKELLARRYPDEWGDKAKATGTAEDPLHIKTEAGTLSPEELAKAIKVLQAAQDEEEG